MEATAGRLHVTSIVQAAGIVSSTSPGAVHSSRAAAVEDEDGLLHCYVASGGSVQRVRIALPEQGAVQAGKEGVLQAVRLNQGQASISNLHGSNHGAEIQSLACCLLPGGAGLALGSVDCYGRVLVHSLAGPQAEAASTIGLEDGADTASREAGWAGLSLQAQDDGSLVVATAMHLAKRLALYTGGQLVRGWQTVQHPTALLLLPSSMQPAVQLLAVAEGHRVCIWDVRTSAPAQVLPPATCSSTCRAMAWCEAEGGLLGVAGDDRSVTLLDPRKWRQMHKWNGCAKYAISHLGFSHLNPRYAYVAGLDYEVICGRWDGKGGHSAGISNAAGYTAEKRAVGPAQMGFGAEGGPQASQAAAGAGAQADGEDGGLSGGRTGFIFRADARCLGMSRALKLGSGGPERELAACFAQSGSVFAVAAVARAPAVAASS